MYRFYNLKKRKHYSHTAFEKFVRMTPGAKQLTRILSPAKSWAAALVNPNNVVLLTEYAPKICERKQSCFV